MAAGAAGVKGRGLLAKLLVTGGAGYVGSHVCEALAAQGHEVVVYDSLVQGHRRAVKWGPLIEGDLLEQSKLHRLFQTHDFAAVLHFAALSCVGDSVRDPGAYYQNNVTGSLNLLRAMTQAGVGKLVFSSTAAVYGAPEQLPLTEESPLAPINPYGASKVMVEQILRDFDRAVGLRSVALRYFNAAGASASGQIGEDHRPETHLLPLAIEAALGRHADFKLFGQDYPTADGTAMRDYVHVEDLARAHLLALDYLLAGGGSQIFNLGAGQATSVRELLAMVGEMVGAPVPYRRAPRRAGDPPVLLADCQKAADILGWKATGSLRDIVASALAWQRKR
tara:strand:+ start:1848 stop:2855 length:1008 start_codon:yes stop_codon:yes gene_type:complete